MINKSDIKTIIQERLETKNQDFQEIIQNKDFDALFTELNIYHTELIAQQEELNEKNFALIESQEEFGTLFNNAPIPFLITDLSLKITNANKKANEELLIANVKSHNISLLIHVMKEDISKLLDWIAKKQYLTSALDIHFITKNQSLKKFQLKAVEYTKNNETLLMISLNDVSYVDEILQANEIFETMFNVSRDPFAIVDLQMNFLKANKAYSVETGYTNKELLSTSCMELTIESEREIGKEKVQEVIEKGYVDNFEKSCQHKNGHVITVLMSMVLLPDKDSILVSLKDLEEIKKRDNIISEQSKMVAIGEMIGNIAHQWRQPLNMISTQSTGSIFQKEMGMLTDEMFYENMEAINDNAQYLSSTIDTFRNFIKSAHDKVLIETTIQKEIDKAILIEKSALKQYFINLHTNILEEDIPILLSDGELAQVLINIINNAKDVLKDKNNEVDRWIKLTLEKASNNSLITIEDNGGGIPEKILPRIFEPYFTTKHQSQGTGLGLNMSYKIVHESLKGTLQAKNTKYGAKFFITIPLNNK